MFKSTVFTLEVSKKSLKSSLTSVGGLFFIPLRKAKKLLFLLRSRSENFIDSLLGSRKLDSKIFLNVVWTSEFSLSDVKSLDFTNSSQTLSHWASSHFRSAVTIETMKGFTVPVSWWISKWLVWWKTLLLRTASLASFCKALVCNCMSFCF